MVIDSSDDEDLDCAKETAPEIRDIDSSNDIFSCSEYASEIFQNLKQSEVHVFILYSSVEVKVSCNAVLWACFDCAAARDDIYKK